MSLNHNTVYPKRYIVTEGNLTNGFAFYGPFKRYGEAAEWIHHNMHVGSVTRIAILHDVKNDL